MKPGMVGVAAAVVGSIALGGGYWLGTRDAVSHTGGRSAETLSASSAMDGTSGAKVEREVLYYRNPMGLADKSPVPKKDSMGMDYIAVYADEQVDDVGTVRVSPARIQTLGVRTELAQRRALDASVKVSARVELNERKQFAVAPRFDGWIEQMHVNAVGDTVKRGQALFTVYSPKLQSASDELRIAQQLLRTSTDPAAAESARRLAQASRTRMNNWQVGGQTGARQTFYAPADGVVMEKSAVQGTSFTAGEVIYRIADLRTVWVLADVFEKNLASIQIGQSAQIVLDAYPGRVFEASVSYIYPTLNAQTRSTQIRLELDNKEGLLRPGMFAQVTFNMAAGNQSKITVPLSALIDDGQRQVVLIALGEGRFKAQPVRVGERGRDYIEVLEGVSEGDRVVVSANFLIDSESNLRSALANMNDAQPEQPSHDAASSKAYQAVGVFNGVKSDAGSAVQTVSIIHEAIPALQWPAMTMDFGLESSDVARGIAQGAPIRFDFEDRGNGQFVITHIKVIDTAGQTQAHTANNAPTTTTSPIVAIEVYHAQGVLKSLDAVAHTVSIKHEPVPALHWPVMTMQFELATPALVEQAKHLPPDLPMHFSFEQREVGRFVITHIQ